jgi:antitoxin component YwqK of YwqJK toxin-antitoxin module
MYSYNSSHKVITILLIMVWAVYHFSQRNTDSLYYDNGQVKSEGNTINSLNEGIWRWYYKDGKVQMQGLFSKGKREGAWKTFTRLGELKTESNYHNNQLNGEYIEYNEFGEITKKSIYENDVQISVDKRSKL